LHLTGQSSIISPHLSAKEVGKCSLYLGSPVCI
jgi:hypothetical protein